MATTLRELIAKVIFRADPSQLEALNQRLDAAKQKLTTLDNQTRKGLGTKVLFQPAVQQAGAAEEAIDEVGDAVKRTNEELKKTKPAADKGLKGLDDFKKLLGGLTVAAAAYKAIAFGTQLVDEARSVGDLAAQLGIATDELQTWQALAEQVGASSEDLTGSVKTLSKNMHDVAKEGKGPAADAFKALGISTAGWSQKLPNTLDMLLETGGALAEVENNAKRMALAQQVLGESSLKLIPAFEGGAAAAKEQLDQLRDLAVVYDKDFIRQATEASNEMKLFERQLKGVGVSILLDVLPALRDFVRWSTPIIKDVRELIKHSNLLTSALGVLGGVGLNAVLLNFGKFLGMLKTGAGVVARFVIPLLILDDIITFLRGGKSVIGGILDAMFGVGAAKKTLDGLKDSWKALSGLIKYVWGLLTGDKKAMEEGEAAILKFGGFIDTIFDSIGKTISGWFAMFGEAWDLFLKQERDAWTAWVDGIADYFVSMFANLASKAKAFASELPLVGGLFKADQPAQLATNAQNALSVGGSPVAPNNSKTTSVTVNDNSTVTTTLNGVDGANVGAALRTSESNVKASLKRNKAQILQQTVGASAT